MGRDHVFSWQLSVCLPTQNCVSYRDKSADESTILVEPTGAFHLLENALNGDKEWAYAASPLLVLIVYLHFQVGEADYLLLTEGLCRELVLTSSNCVIRRV